MENLLVYIDKKIGHFGTLILENHLPGGDLQKISSENSAYSLQLIKRNSSTCFLVVFVSANLLRTHLNSYLCSVTVQK